MIYCILHESSHIAKIPLLFSATLKTMHEIAGRIAMSNAENIMCKHYFSRGSLSYPKATIINNQLLNTASEAYKLAVSTRPYIRRKNSFGYVVTH